MWGTYFKIRLFDFLMGFIIFGAGIIPAYGSYEPIVVEEGVSYKEITVEKGIDFLIRLPGSGWYLNRFDRKNLSFKTRINEPEYTEFVINPIQEGPTYLFFSYVHKDVYVLVRVVDTSTQAIADEEGERGSEEEKQVVLQHGIKLESPKNEKERQMTIRSDILSDREIFYIDEENRKVSVPYSDENDSYNRGLRLFDKGMFPEALESFQEYLTNCKRCEYLDEAHFRSVNAYVKTGQEEEAIKHLEKLIRDGSDKYKKEASFLKAEIDFKEGRILDALGGYKVVLEFEPENRDLLKKVGDIYFQLEEYENALDMYVRSIENGIESDEIYFRTAIIYDSPGKLRNLEEAYRYYKILIDRYRDSEHYTYAKKRVGFFEKNFYKYK
jgi:tetratricopeptide (TPR) repeat protein